MVATHSSEMSVDFQWTTWRYIPEVRALYSSFVLLMLVALKACIIFSSLFQEKQFFLGGMGTTRAKKTIKFSVTVMNQNYTITSEI
jgi:hypothetical protein